MVEKLLALNVDKCTTAWIFEFLTNRLQYVKCNGVNSLNLITNTGAPQGCVLSPVLYTIYTNDFKLSTPDICLIKFADDSTIQGLINESEDTYFPGHTHFY